MSTLARLSFWVPPERMGDFETVYRKKLLPILGKHGLEESSERGRRTVEGVFHRLFEVETPSEVAVKEMALRSDAAWQEALRRLGAVFSTTPSDRLLRAHLGLYRASAGAARTVPAGSGMQQGVWHTLKIIDGLPSSGVNAIFQDRKGNLWFGTEGGGVCRYDGMEFTTFTTEDGLASDWIEAIFQDQAGHLWFGTGARHGRHGRGVSRYDGKTFTTFTTEDGLAGDWVKAIVQDREGMLWFGTGCPEAMLPGGVSRYDPSAGSGESGEGFITFTTEEGLGANAVWSILEDSEGVLWFGTRGGGVSRYDRHAPREEPFVTFTTEDGLAHHNVDAIVEDRDGHLWFGTCGGGISRYDADCSDGEPFRTFTTDDGLAHRLVSSMVEDREGVLWIGTNGGGVSRYDGGTFRTLTTKDGLGDDQVWSVFEDRDGNLWFGTQGGGVSRYDARHMATFTTEDGLVHNAVCCALEDRGGNLWFGTWEGVSRYDGEKFINFTMDDGLVDNGMGLGCIFEDREGVLWFGTAGGVSRYDGERFINFTTDDGLGGNRVTSMLEDREGVLWFGTAGGVSRYEAGRSDRGEFVTFTTDDGLGSDAVSPILEDRAGHLWFALERGGVSGYDGEGFVTLPPGYGGAQVLSLLEDREGHLWVGTYGGGIHRYDGLVWQSLSARDGLGNDAVHKILQDRNGTFWIATQGGVTRYRPHGTPPSIHLREVVADRRYGPVAEVRVPVSQKVIGLEFQGGSFTTPSEKMVYVYRLKNGNEDWQVTRDRRVEYHDLPLGEYVFQVKAVDRDLNYSEPASVRITVEPDPHLDALTRALSASGAVGEFVGASDALHRMQTQLREVAPTDLTVLILGETGTGKGLAARTLHALSAWRGGPFIQVNCGAIPEGLVESELFGHERGAFTGATHRQMGRVELAEGGTLFLDEIGDMPLDAQTKLLHVLEEHTFQRVGGKEALKAEVRIIAATNRDLGGMVRTGVFREDLYFRLQGFVIALPPLRDRVEDIPLLAEYFAERFARHLDRPAPDFSEEALARLQAHRWPGNVRELEHVVQRGVLMCVGDRVEVEDVVLPSEQEASPMGEAAFLPLEEQEKRYIERALKATGGVIFGEHGAAKLLDINPHTLRRRIKKHGLHPPD